MNYSSEVTLANDTVTTGLYDPPYVEEEIYSIPPHVVAFLSTCYGSISVAAVLGNGLVMWVIMTSFRLKNVTNFYIVNLALADIINGLFSIPFEFQAALLQRWTLPHFMCSFCPFVKTVSVSVSVFTLVAIAVDRKRAVIKPFKPRMSRIEFRVAITVIWMTGILMGIPWLYFMGIKKIDDKEGGLEDFCYHIRVSPTVMVVYRGILVVLQYIIPLSVITWMYARITFALWGSSAPGNAQSDRDENILRNKKKEKFQREFRLRLRKPFKKCLRRRNLNSCEMGAIDNSRFELQRSSAIHSKVHTQNMCTSIQ